MCPEYSVSYLSITTEGPPCEGLFVFVFLANLFRTPQFEPGRAKRADRLRSEARQPKGRAAAGSESISPGPLSAIPGVDSSLRPSALRANVQGVVQICFADLSRHSCIVHIARQKEAVRSTCPRHTAGTIKTNTATNSNKFIGDSSRNASRIGFFLSRP